MLMQPNQPGTPGNPYDFIFNSPSPPQKGFGAAGGSGMKKRILIAGVGATVLVIFAIIATSFLGSAGKADNAALLSMVEQQHEIMRLADVGISKAKGPEAQNLAITTKLTLASSQKDIQSYATKRGVKIDQKLLSEKKNSKTDAALTAAEQSNRFDEAFIQVLESHLAKYQASLKKAHGEATDKKDKEKLAAAFKDTALLVNKPEDQPEGGTSPSS